MSHFAFAVTGARQAIHLFPLRRAARLTIHYMHQKRRALLVRGWARWHRVDRRMRARMLRRGASGVSVAGSRASAVGRPRRGAAVSKRAATLVSTVSGHIRDAVASTRRPSHRTVWMWPWRCGCGCVRVAQERLDGNRLFTIAIGVRYVTTGTVSAGGGVSFALPSSNAGGEADAKPETKALVSVRVRLLSRAGAPAKDFLTNGVGRAEESMDLPLDRVENLLLCSGGQLSAPDINADGTLATPLRPDVLHCISSAVVFVPERGADDPSDSTGTHRVGLWQVVGSGNGTMLAEHHSSIHQQSYYVTLWKLNDEGGVAVMVCVGACLCGRRRDPG